MSDHIEEAKQSIGPTAGIKWALIAIAEELRRMNDEKQATTVNVNSRSGLGSYEQIEYFSDSPTVYPFGRQP